MVRKEFTAEVDGKEIKLAVRQPTTEEINEADRAYAACVAQLVRESGKKKLLLRSEIDKFLRETGIWTDVEKDAVAKLEKEIQTLLNQLKAGGIKLCEGRKICLDILDKRKSIMNINAKRQVFDNTTIESAAEQDKVDYFIYACTVDAETGEHFWPSLEDMKNTTATNVYSSANSLVYEVVFGIDIQFEKGLPENRWLKRFNYIDENLNYTDRKTGERVDKDGRPLEIFEKEIQEKIDLIQGDIKEDAPYIEED